jgi:phospholipid-translocating ATPase
VARGYAQLGERFTLAFTFFAVGVTVSVALADRGPFSLNIGFLFTYLAPLIFVLFITMCKEAFDDFQRYRRDKELNTAKIELLTGNGFRLENSMDIKVG